MQTSYCVTPEKLEEIIDDMLSEGVSLEKIQQWCHWAYCVHGDGSPLPSDARVKHLNEPGQRALKGHPRNDSYDPDKPADHPYNMEQDRNYCKDGAIMDDLEGIRKEYMAVIHYLTVDNDPNDEEEEPENGEDILSVA